MNQPVPEPKQVFLEAIEKSSPEELIRYLDEACQGNLELRGLVEQLLRGHHLAGKFLGGSCDGATIAPGVSEQAGTQIGPYKLNEQIGEGGMGTVWMAQQTEPVKRLVALKLIKAGMDSAQVIARFEAERQALALMDHPNIARVLDAGTTAAGRPYFVMDLVKGMPITRYSDEHHLTPRQRLELFIPVCQAVQHAHQKGIIHRDLKPSNVLVALYDGKPVPKVIDFGVAKATGQSLTDKTLVTGFGNIVGTLEYMSPEQAEVNQLDIDTRSDIYSLGVLLYELLAGSPPFTRKELEQAGMLEMLRVIREQEPSRPSTKLSSSDALPTLSANRGTEPAKLTRLVRGELDWIVMKALEKDRNRRYETANGFAMDVQRYLADEAVQACPPSVGYRLKKFARRNRGGLAVAALVLFFLVLLGSGIGWAVRDRSSRAVERANNLERAVERAELLQREGKRGAALAALERALLLVREAEPMPTVAERIASLQQVLDAEGRDEAFVVRLEAIRREVQTDVDLEKQTFSSFLAYPKIREALVQYGIAPDVTPPTAAVADIRKRPAAIQSVVVAALSECLRFAPDQAPSSIQWLTDVLEQADSDPWRNKVRRALRQPATLEALAKDLDVGQQPPSFLLLLVSALPIESQGRWDLARRVQFAYPGDFWANHALAWDLEHSGKQVEAVRYYTAALALRPDNPGVLLNRANALRSAGELEAAVADLRRAIAVSPRYATAHTALGIALSDQNKLEEAVAACRKAVELAPKSWGAFNNLGIVLWHQGQRDDAIAAFREAIDHDPVNPGAYTNLGNALAEQEDQPGAVAAYRKAIEFGQTGAEVHNNLGVALYAQEKLDQAVAAYHQAIEIDQNYAAAHSNLGNALRGQKKLDEAIAAYGKAIELDPKSGVAYSNLGALLCSELKDYEKAVEWLRKAIEIDPQDANTWSHLGTALGQQGKLDDAVVAYRKALDIDPKHATARNNLGVALNSLARALATHAEPARRDPGRAVRLAVEAVNLMPEAETFWTTLGVAQYRAGDWKAAITALEESTKRRTSGDSTDWFFLAMAHWQLGEKDKAREWYDRAVQWMDKNQPNNEELIRLRAEAAELLELKKEQDQDSAVSASS